MYIPILIDGSNPDKPVFQQDDHNQQLCMQARFPHMLNVFYYDDGMIVGINTEFEWCEAKVSSTRCVRFILAMISSESLNIGRFVDASNFTKAILNARNIIDCEMHPSSPKKCL